MSKVLHLAKDLGRPCTYLLGACVVVLSGCGSGDGGSSSPAGPPGPAGNMTGSLIVSVVTSGDDLDADGYTLAVDGGQSQQVGINGEVTFANLSTGSHQVEVANLAHNCGPPGAGANPRTVTVASPSSSISLQLVCNALQSFGVDVSPDGSKIAFSGEAADGEGIFVAGALGENPVRLTDGGIDAAWSPDGSQIAFAREGIWVMNADGSNPVMLTATASDGSPTWSPDGSKIAFHSSVNGSFEIWVMDSDGGNQTPLTNDPRTDEFPAWSPDGAQIIFDSNRSGSVDLFAIKPDGTGVTQVTSTSNLDRAPDYSPDGSRIAFASAINLGTFGNLWIADPDGSNEVMVTNAPATGPSWSSDGTQIYFESDNALGHFEIWRINPDGSGLRQITDLQP